jgi:hypothetical protein
MLTLSDSTSCLVRGWECVYGENLQPSRSVSQTPSDPFGSLPIPMPGKSQLVEYESK